MAADRGHHLPGHPAAPLPAGRAGRHAARELLPLLHWPGRALPAVSCLLSNAASLCFCCDIGQDALYLRWAGLDVSCLPSDGVCGWRWVRMWWGCLAGRALPLMGRWVASVSGGSGRVGVRVWKLGGVCSWAGCFLACPAISVSREAACVDGCWSLAGCALPAVGRLLFSFFFPWLLPPLTPAVRAPLRWVGAGGGGGGAGGLIVCYWGWGEGGLARVVLL